MLRTKRTTFIRKPPGYFPANRYRRDHSSRTGFERHRPATANHSTGISILDPSIRSVYPMSPIFDPPRSSFFLREASSPPQGSNFALPPETKPGKPVFPTYSLNISLALGCLVA